MYTRNHFIFKWYDYFLSKGRNALGQVYSNCQSPVTCVESVVKREEKVPKEDRITALLNTMEFSTA